MTLKSDEVLQGVLKNVKASYLYIYGVRINTILSNSEKIDYYLSLLANMTLEDKDKKEYLYLNAKTLLDRNADIAQINLVLDELLKLDRYNAKYYFLLGRLQFEQGQATEAADSLKKAIEYDLDYSITDEATRLLSSVD